MLLTAVLMETAIAMVILSRVLKYGANRWMNIISGAFHTLFVFWSLIGDPVSLFYIFFAVIEMACTLLIVWLAIKVETGGGVRGPLRSKAEVQRAGMATNRLFDCSC